MKLAKGALAKALDRPDPAVRLYLFHGADESQSRAHAQRLLAALGATKAILLSSTLKSDPALLASEAGAMSLFGGARLIWIEPAGDEIASAIESLFDSPVPESCVVAIAGTLRKTSALLKLAEGSPAAVAFASYAPEGQDAERMVVEVGRTFGLKVPPSVASRLAESCGNDQAVVRQELSKLALYLDAAPEQPRELDHDALDAVGADLPEGDFQRIADLALSGDLAALSDELGLLLAAGGEAIPILRSLQRRLLMLAPARARVERGESVSGVMASLDRSLFFKEKPLVGRLLQGWSAEGLARAMDRAGSLERDVMLTPVPPVEALAEELVAIARAGRRR